MVFGGLANFYDPAGNKSLEEISGCLNSPDYQW